MASYRSLPPEFLIGCATAAHQVEGQTHNDWTLWARDDPTRIADGANADIACDHLRRYDADLRQLGAMSQDAHRLSIEWSRVEPREGFFDSSALRHYADVVSTCRRAGMEPIVTLHHFTLPIWLAEEGGVLHPHAAPLFARYVARCADALGETVRLWVTINEPAVLAVMGYLYGVWPPGMRSLPRCLAAMGAMLRMHAAGAMALRRATSSHTRAALVSIAHAERPQRPSRAWHPMDRAASVAPDLLFNRWFLRSCVAGRCWPPVGRGERITGLSNSLDYLGVNYYAEDTIRFDAHSPRTFFARQLADPRLPHSSFGWSIDPPAMTRALVTLWREFHLPMLVTENGVADRGDELRPRFVVDHLNAVLDAIEHGVDLMGYLHWTAWDNFEWAEGFTKRFGLFAVDTTTLERRAKPSAMVYERIARERRVPATAGESDADAFSAISAGGR